MGGLLRLVGLLAFEAAADQFVLGGEAAGGAVAVAAGSGLVKDAAQVPNRLIAGDDLAADHAAAPDLSLRSCSAVTP